MIHPAQIQHGGKPIHRRDHLPSHLSLWQLGRVADDRRHPNAALEERTLLPDPFAGGSAAARAVKMILRITAFVFVHANTIAGFLRVPVVAHENDNRVFAQPVFLQPIDHLPNVIIGGGHDGAVRSARGILHVLVQRLVSPKGLLRVVRYVERHVEKKRTLLVSVDKLQCTLHHQFGKIKSGRPHRGGSLVQIVEPGAMQKVMVVVVDEPIADAKEFIEALLLRAVVPMRAEVPLAVEGSAVASRLQCLGQRHLLQRHVDALGRVHVALRPMHHPAPLRMPPGQQRRPCRATNCMCVSLCEPDTSLRQLVDVRGDQVGRAVAVGVYRALIVGKENHHIGLGRLAKRYQAKRN